MAARRRDTLAELDKFAAREGPPPGMLVEKVPTQVGPFFGAVLDLFKRQGRILRPPPPGPSAKVVHPTRRGLDLNNITKTRDAHVRLERLDTFDEIFVGVFDSQIPDPDEAELDNDSFPNDERGAAEATEYLRTFAFDVKIVPGRSR